MEYEYFVSSSLTAFSLRTMREVDAQILIGQLSYQQIADMFNHIHHRSSKHHVQYASIKRLIINYYYIVLNDFYRALQPVFERYKLDRRRIELSHLQFAALQVSIWYPENFDRKKLPLHSNMDDTLSRITETYHGIFMEYYASKIILYCGKRIQILISELCQNFVMVLMTPKQQYTCSYPPPPSPLVHALAFQPLHVHVYILL
jgi:hypothetical protein